MGTRSWVSHLALVAALWPATSFAADQAGVAAAVRGKITMAREQVVGQAVSSGQPILMQDAITSGPLSGMQILLLDETLAGLGHNEVAEVIGAVRRLAELGITIVIIEHTMRAMVRLVDHFVVLDHGALLVEGEPEAITKDPRVVEAYLGRRWSADAPH